MPRETPNQSTKLTASKAAIYALGVCHPRLSFPWDIASGSPQLISVSLGADMDDPRHLAEEYLSKLSRALAPALKDSASIHARVAESQSHAPGFQEVRFCKGCILPVVDRVTTDFFATRLALPAGAARAALRCEGASTLPDIYAPSEGQSGFSGITWGTNYQTSDKSGRAGAYRPCPDFGIVHPGPPRLNILGEVKYAPKAPRRDILLAAIRKDMIYYMGLQSAPAQDWHYEFGVGIAYGAAAGTVPVVEVLADDWDKKNFFIMLFHNTTRGT